ncbi:MAG: homoserine O-succinyltransferase MetX [Gemmatimonadaceae bacterium]
MSFAGAAAVGYEIIGPPDTPVVLALGGISADRHVTTGWWARVAGERRAIDTTERRVLGLDFLGGGVGADGRPAREVTTHDQADAIVAVLDELSIERLHAVVGASYGGMVALAFAERYPDRVERLVAIGAAHRAHPMTTARRVIQRGIVELGLDTGRAFDALALARALAMTTYRSDAEFAQRFASGNPVAVDSYLRHHGEKFARRFTPQRFLALSLSSDLHRVDPARVRATTTLVVPENDSVVPRADVEELARALAAPCRIMDLPSIHGHDAFLTDTESLSHILRDALASQPTWSLS